MKNIKEYIINEGSNKFVRNIKSCSFQIMLGNVNPRNIDVNDMLEQETLELSDYWKYGPVPYLYSVYYELPDGKHFHGQISNIYDYESNIMVEGVLFSEFEINKYISNQKIKDKIIKCLREYHKNGPSSNGPFGNNLWVEYDDLTVDGKKYMKNLLSHCRMGEGNGNYWTNTDCVLDYVGY